MAVYDEQKRKEFRAYNEFCTPFSTIYHHKQTHKKATFALYLALTSKPTLDERASHVYFVRNTNKEYEKQKNSHYDFVCWFDSKSKWTIAKQAVAVLTHFQSFFTFRSFFSLSLDLFVSMENVRYAVDVHATCGIIHTHTRKHSTFQHTWIEPSIYFHSRNTEIESRKSKSSASFDLKINETHNMCVWYGEWAASYRKIPIFFSSFLWKRKAKNFFSTSFLMAFVYIRVIRITRDIKCVVRSANAV